MGARRATMQVAGPRGRHAWLNGCYREWTRSGSGVALELSVLSAAGCLLKLHSWGTRWMPCKDLLLSYTVQVVARDDSSLLADFLALPTLQCGLALLHVAGGGQHGGVCMHLGVVLCVHLPRCPGAVRTPREFCFFCAVAVIQCHADTSACNAGLPKWKRMDTASFMKLPFSTR